MTQFGQLPYKSNKRGDQDSYAVTFLFTLVTGIGTNRLVTVNSMARNWFKLGPKFQADF